MSPRQQDVVSFVNILYVYCIPYIIYVYAGLTINYNLLHEVCDISQWLLRGDINVAAVNGKNSPCVLRNWILLFKKK